MLKLIVTMDDPEVERLLRLLDREGIGHDSDDRRSILTRASNWLDRASMQSYPPAVVNGEIVTASAEFAVLERDGHE